MSGLFGKLKDAFGSKPPPPKFKQYNASELKVVAMKTRLILEQRMEAILASISKDDQQFRYAGQDPHKMYSILQAIGEKVVEAESIKVLIEMMRKVENFSNKIVQTNGDIALLKQEVQWFQCVLWYRRSREVTNLEDLYSFCLNFFKGVDITSELNVHCEIFQFFPILKYLPSKGGFPIHELLPYMSPYVTYPIDAPTL
jgi:hypothetical protein